MLFKSLHKLLQATRIASSPSKVFDETLQAVLHPDGKRATPSQSFEYNAAITIEVAEQILIKYLSVVIGRMSRNSGSRGDTTPIVSHVARSILKMIAKQNFPSVITVMELKSFLCNLCSFRTLQKKLQVVRFVTVKTF